MLLNFHVGLNKLKTSTFDLLMGLGFALYVYRFPIAGANMTVLRFATMLLAVMLIFLIFRAKKRFSIRHLWLSFGIFVLILMNAIWYPTLNHFPIPQKEMVSHLVNLVMMYLLVVWMDSDRQLCSSLNGYLFAAVLAIFIGYYGLIFGEIPFEQLLRDYGAVAAQDMTYVIEDRGETRLSGPFMDPNFFGVYLFSVIVYSLWLYQFRSKSKFYLILAIVALITLPLTISRTAIFGSLVFLLLYLGWISKRVKSILILVLSWFSVIALILFSSIPWEFFERMLDTSSGLDRLRFIDRGLAAFGDSPLFGSGPASIVDPVSGIATAHLMYLSLLAKFGIFGAIAYITFIFYPVIQVLIYKNRYLREYRLLVVGLYLPLFFMYLLYDFMYFLEFQYFIFAVGYSVVLSRYSKNSDCSTAYSMRSNKVGRIFKSKSRKSVCVE